MSDWIVRAEAILRRIGISGCVATVFLWLLEISGTFENHDLSKVVASLAAATVAGWIVAWAVSAFRQTDPRRRVRSVALLGLLALTVPIRFAGLDFELMDHPVNDEGVYQEVARKINNGETLPETFNYGHFLYYAGAFAMWLQELFPEGVMKLYSSIFNVDVAYGVDRLLLKSVNAVLAVLTTGAVFGAAYRVGGLLAGTLGGLLICFSTLYNSVAHQAISDVPAAAFAAFTLYFAARLLDRERLRDYLAAGVMAGLAAGSKYPGGVSALAILSVWLYWRIRERRWSWSLVWAALASIVCMLLVMPSLWVNWASAFSGEGLDLLFGFRQYAYGGWLGVQPESVAGWYQKELVYDFGWPTITLAVVGFFLLGAERRRKWLLLAIFPIGYLVLIMSMSMVVHRNLQPALPGVAVLVGAAMAALIEKIARTSRPWGRLAALVLVLGVLIAPACRTLAWDISHSRPGTRQLGLTWLEEHVPEGSSIVRERYTTRLDPKKFTVVNHRFAAWQDPEEMKEVEWDYLMLARPAYQRFLDLAETGDANQREHARRYQAMLEFERVAEFEPGLLRAGPLMSIHRLSPDSIQYRSHRRFEPADVTFVSSGELLRDGPGTPLQYTYRWQYAVFKDFFKEGPFQAALRMDPLPSEGYLHVVDWNNHEVGTFNVLEPIEFDLPAKEKYLLRVFLAPPARLHSLRIARVEEGQTSNRVSP